MAIVKGAQTVQMDFLNQFYFAGGASSSMNALLDYSGITGNRMVTDSTGKLTYAPNNLLTYSEQFDNAVWSLYRVTISANQIAPNGASTAYLCDDGTLSGSHNIYRASSSTFVVGQTYIMSVYAKDVSRGYVNLAVYNTSTNYVGTTFNLTTQTTTTGQSGTGYSVTSSGMTSAGNGWYRCWMTFVVGTANNFSNISLVDGTTIGSYGFTTYTGSNKQINIWGAQLEAVTYQTAPRAYIPTTSAAVYLPRFDYDASTTPATPRGMLIEESRSNLVTYSEQFDNAAWTKSNNITATPNQAISPSGTLSACSVTPTENTSGTLQILQSQTKSASSVAYSGTLYVKASSGLFLHLYIDGNSTSNAGRIIFNTTNWSITSTNSFGTFTGATGNISSVGNGWYRISCSVTSGTETNIRFNLYITSSSSTVIWTPVGGEYVYLWGAQLEAGSFATSYIPTVASSVTRVADVLKNTSISSWFNVSAGSAIVEYNIPNALATSAAARLVDFSDGTTSNWHTMWVGQAIGKAASQNTFLSGTGQGRIDATPAFTAGQTARVGFTYKVNYRAIAGNGTTPVTSTALSSLPSTTRFGLGSNYSGLEQINGWIRSFAYYNQSLPDAILQSKSTVGGPY